MFTRFVRAAAVVGFALPAGLVSADSGSMLPIRAAIEGATVAVDAGRTVGRLNLQAGPARLEIKGGVVYPVAGPDGEPFEFVFLGRAKFVLDPGVKVERQQVALFTGGETIEETVTRAVLVPADPAVRRALLAGTPLPERDPVRAEQASEAFGAWRSSPWWRRSGVFPALVAARAEGPAFAGYFASLLHGEVLGDFLYVVDPDEREPASVTQWIPAEVTEVHRQAVRDAVRRDQKLGRLRDLVPDDLLVSWNTWTSSGDGREPFTPVGYTLDVTIDRFPLELTTRTTVTARATHGDRRVVRMGVSSDNEVLAVRGADGTPLGFVQYAGDLVLDLGRAVPAGEEARFAIETRGRLVEDTSQGSYALRSTVGWHPRLPGPYNTVFEATFRYPKSLELLASGREVERGASEGRQVQRRVLDVPALGFTFEIGKFTLHRRKAGHVDVLVAFDQRTRMSTEVPREEVAQTVADAVAYYEGIFGPYPFDHLTVVTANRGFSQGLLSFLTISTGALSLEDEFRKFFQVSDARTVVAHEVAHQWWGNIVGWDGYRDQWISEAMATYASNLFARKMSYGGKGQVRISMTAGWRHEVQETTDRGIPVEALGPVSLGVRLSSSLHPRAYASIVYMKGAIVLETLARYFTKEEDFLRAARAVVDRSRGECITTDRFLAELGRDAILDLRPFADRFVYGTGIPDVYYTYTIRAGDPGEWFVEGTVVKTAIPGRRFAVTRLEDGRFDVARSPVPSMDLAEFPLVVPTQVAVRRESEPPPAAGAKTLLERANALVEGRLVLDRPETKFVLRFHEEPTGFWIDLRREAFLSSFSEKAYPKKATFFRAVEARVRGDASAEELFRRAVEAPPDEPADRPRRPEERDAEHQESRIVDALATAALAHLAMDRGDLEAARRWVDRAETPDAFLLRIAGKDLMLVRARLELLQGNAAGAWARLERKLFAPVRLVRTTLAADVPDDITWQRTEGPLQDPEGYALGAIAARAAGRPEDYARVLQLAKRFGVDVAVLEAN